MTVYLALTTSNFQNTNHLPFENIETFLVFWVSFKAEISFFHAAKVNKNIGNPNSV